MATPKKPSKKKDDKGAGEEVLNKPEKPVIEEKSVTRVTSQNTEASKPATDVDKPAKRKKSSPENKIEKVSGHLMEQLNPDEKKPAGKKSRSSKKDIQATGEANVKQVPAASEVEVPPTKEKKIVVKKSAKTAETKNQETTGSTTKQPAPIESKPGGKLKKITFQLRYHTNMGESIFVMGDEQLLGNNDPNQAFALEYLNDEYWLGTVDIPKDYKLKPFGYKYFVKDISGNVEVELDSDKFFDPAAYDVAEVRLSDSWNFAGYYENTFYTEPFKKVLLVKNFTPANVATPENFTHTFRVKAPLLGNNQVVGIYGSSSVLGKWDTANPILLSKKVEEDWWKVDVDLTEASFPLTYKYGIHDVERNKFIQMEGDKNRIIYDGAHPDKLTVVSDGFAVFPNSTFRGAGVAIPVFSLRTNESFGVGEFKDIKKLVDWASLVGLKVVQILPVNDTIATNSWVDSYPYAAISAFALHPMFLNLATITKDEHKGMLDDLEGLRQELNKAEAVDYERVVNTKLAFLKKLFPLQKDTTFNSEDFISFYNDNKHWLVPYAVFSYLRDEFGTPDFTHWPSHNRYDESEVRGFVASPGEALGEVGIHFFTQYHLHLQLKAATEYAHQNGIIVKGDIPIGIYRNSADAWQEPGLYNMDKQAGAPPDDFAIKGQNWGFPTYNWQRMQQNGFTWWKRRFAQMSYYFDAFRIDHILGFFRIWSIPMHAVEGIMGNFVPAVPLYSNELDINGIHLDRYRLTAPYITDAVIGEIFGDLYDRVKNEFLYELGNGHFALKQEYDTQRKVENHFSNQPASTENDSLKYGLFDLISNVILFEIEGSDRQQYHFRIAMDSTSSFRYLDSDTQNKLKDLYVNYFFRRQDHYWREQAMQKLPELKRSTNMLICGEDLGMVPDCVPGVMSQLGILSLEIQRMPKDPTKEFFHPNDAPYLSVVTPSTHDMSTIRGWWEENLDKTQRFYNYQLGKWGNAPFFCEPEINTAIIIQHLYSPAMWSIFQLQDLMGMDGALRRANPADERINVPANPRHYWQYRMHLTLEDLQQQEGFNTVLRDYISASGR